MEYTVYLTFEQNGDPYNVSQVRFATEDPSADNYGVLDLTTGTANIPYGTIVTPTQTGYYPYTLTLEDGHAYLVSWEVTVNFGDVPTYRTEQIGPFHSIENSNIRACTSFGGKFRQGTTATFLLKTTRFDGMPQDPEDISVLITNDRGESVTLDSYIPEHVDTGFYVFDWGIPVTQSEGQYYLTWTYIVDDIEMSELQKFTVSADALDTQLYSGRVLEFRLALEHHLACAQSIPVYQEQAKPTRDYQTFEFSFPRWNQCAGVKIYRNQNIVNEGAAVDFFKGTVTFDEPLSSYDVVNADYNFRWFSDEQLNRYLSNSVQSVNIYPPASPYSLWDVPDRFIPAVLYGAAKDALRQLIMCLQFQQPQQVFGGSEAAQQAAQAFEQLKQNYEKDWEKLLEQKKFGPYPRTRITVTPEYTLPGGRSRWFRYLFKGI